MSENIEYGKHIKFIPAPMPEERKTKGWWVVNKYEDIQLGTIEWFTKFRCYSFFPKENTVYEKTCLRDIANFCEGKTTDHLINKGGIMTARKSLVGRSVRAPARSGDTGWFTTMIDVPTFLKSWFYKNCKRQRKVGAKICGECPFRDGIEQLEAQGE